MITGDGIDIMALSANDIANNYTEYLEDLSDQGWIEHVSSGLLGDAKLDGNVVGLPVNIEGYGIAYNKAIFDAAGIDTSELVTYEAIDQAFADLQNMIDEGKLTDEFPLLEAVEEYAAKESWVLGLHTFNIAVGNEFANAKEALEAETIELVYEAELKELYDLLTRYTSSETTRNCCWLLIIQPNRWWSCH